MSNDLKGFDDLSKELEDYLKSMANVQEVLETGAKALVNDLLKLPKPKSKIRKSGYVHLVDTFTYKKTKNNEVEVGWGKYYGPFVEKGTRKMRPQPHLRPLWDSNKEKYFKIMINKIERN